MESSSVLVVGENVNSLYSLKHIKKALNTLI